MTNHEIFAYKTLRWVVLYFNVFGLPSPGKKDDMLDSLDGKERSYDNSTNGINFTIRKVNLMFVFIAVVWIFLFSKYMIQNPVFLCIMLLCYLLFTQLSCGLISS